MTYAVFKSGGKQHKVSEGDEILVELLSAEPGTQVSFDQVLLVSGEAGVRVGEPIVENANVTAEVIGHEKGEKIRIIKLRRRKHYRRQGGHRQNYTRLKITGIE